MADAPRNPNEYQEPRNLDALAASEAGGVVDAIDRHRIKILVAIAGGAIAFCAILVGAQLKKQKHIDASEAYTSAANKGEIASLDSVLVNFPGSIPAGNALLTKADIQINQGKSEDARATLERFVADFRTHPRYPQGLFVLANFFHIAGEAEMAKSHYERTIQEQGHGELTPLARIRLGDLALEAGDTVTADQFYQDSFTLQPGNPFSEYAEQKIALLKVGNPPVVERPAPEPEPVAEVPAPAPAVVVESPAESETPKPETPKTETPKAETPKAEAPKAEAPKAEAPKAEAPKAETPKAETPNPAPSDPKPAKAKAPKPGEETPALQEQ